MQKSFLLLLLCVIFISCNDDDYREAYIGTYQATKSNSGFDDENFKTEIDDISIELADRGSAILLNGVELEIEEDGTTGLQTIDGIVYNLSIEENSFRLQVYPDVQGRPIVCFITGNKI